MKSNPPLFSIIIPTYGEATYLGKVLSGLANQSERDFETIIVNNNPYLKTNTHTLPQSDLELRIIHESRNGLSYARNAGIANSMGRFIAFLDDDGVPDYQWLANLITGIDRYHADMLGGTVRLILPKTEPSWFYPELRGLLSELIYDGEDIPDIGDDLYIVGANMCVSKAACQKVGGFSHYFDRTATTLRSSGELEYAKRLQRAGYRVSFIASAFVWHHISENRLQKKYFISRLYWQGRSDALLEMKWGRPAAFGRRDNVRI